MAFSAVKDSEFSLLMEYTPLTPPLTPKKNQTLKPALSWPSPLIEPSRNLMEERLAKKGDQSEKFMQSKSKEVSSSESIIPKKFAAAPPTILVPPIHLLSFQEDRTKIMADDEKPIRATFKLQDPPKGKVKSNSSNQSSNSDENDSAFNPSEPTALPRVKGQTSITQFMFPSAQQSPVGPSKCKIAQSPCTPSKRARSDNDFTDDDNLFVFPSVPRGATVRIPSSPLISSSSPNWKKCRKRSIDDQLFSDTEVTDEFLELNMSSPTPLDSSLYGRGRNSDEAIDVSPRLEKNSDCRKSTHFHEHNQMEMDNSISNRYDRLNCDESPQHRNCHRRKSYSSSPVFHQEISSSSRAFGYYESTSIDQDSSFVSYPTTPLKREDVDGDSYFEAVSCAMKTKPQTGQGKAFQEPPPHYKWIRPIKHSLSDLVPSEFVHHEPDCGIPESFPFVSTFKSAYDEQGVYRRDESCCAWSATENESPGKILCRRVSNKESIREREYLHDERYWIYMKNYTNDCIAASSHTIPSHSEENLTSPTRTTSSRNNHQEPQIFPQSNYGASQHQQGNTTHVPRSPVSRNLPSPNLKSRMSLSPSTKLQQFHLPKSVMTEKYLDGSRNSSLFHEHYATENTSVHRRQSPLHSPSGSNMKCIFPAKHCHRSHTTATNASWSSNGMNPSCHFRCQCRTSPSSSSKWQDEEQHGLLTRRRLFSKFDAASSSESIVGRDEEETNQAVCHCCHCVDESPSLSFSSADSVIAFDRSIQRFLPSHHDEARETCECHERSRSNQNYKKCPCLQNRPQISGMYAYRKDLKKDNSYSI